MNKTNILTAIVVVLAIVAVLSIVLNVKQKHDNDIQSEDIAAMEEMMAFEKEQLESEYQDLAIQYDGYQINISNDSLVQLLAEEKQRVQDLLEELRVTKATDGRRIAELKKELATVRAVMKEYVAQIDSLSRTNKALVQENRQVREQYQQVSAERETLAKEKTQLTEVVNRASMMEVGNFHLITLNKRDRETSSVSRITKLQFNFSVLKNVTTQPGYKTVYVQLRRPDGDLMLQSEGRTFAFEGKQIPYSLSKEFEYSGEAVSMTLYWPLESELTKGTYTIEFFIDGNLCGSFPFKIG